jgi:putative acyl-CoA dehydrogenase
VHGRETRHGEGSAHDPGAVDETRSLLGQDGRFDALVLHTETLVREAVEDEFVARPMTEAVARLLQGAELLRHSTPEVIDIFLNTRVPNGSGSSGSHYGTLAFAVDHAKAQKVTRRAMVAG